MKRITLLLILALSLPITARADDASRRDKAKQLLILMHTDRMLQQMMDAMTKQVNAMTGQMAANNLTPEQKAKIADLQKQLFSMITSQVSYQSLEPDYIELYADNFTDEELDGMLAFYKSPAGQSVIEKLPTLTTQAMQLGQKRMIALLPQIQQMIADFAKNCPDCKPAPVIGGVAGFGNSTPPSVRLGTDQTLAAFAGQALRIQSSMLNRNLIQRTDPIYPPIARAAHVQGVVIMHALIGKDGHIEKLDSISGPPMLVSAAEDAVRQWVYRPYLLNGEPAEVATTINVNFTFGPSPQPPMPSFPSVSDGPTMGGTTPQ